jgi:hypothetical protein
MPSYDEIRDDFERGVRTAEQHIEHPFRRHAADAAPPTPATVPATMKAATAAAPPQEDTMPLLDTLKTHVEADLAEVEAKLKGLDEAALGKLNTVMANPETADILNDINGLASVVGIPQGAIAGVASGLKVLLGLYAPDPAAAPAPVAAPAQ